MSDTPVPPGSDGNPFLDREDVLTEVRAAFAARDPQYGMRRGELKAQLAPLADRLENLQAEGHPMGCSDQIRLELQWLLNYRDDWDRAANRLTDLQQSLTNLDQGDPTQDDGGSWGHCCTEWYRKLEPTVDALQGDLPPPELVRSLRFMQRLADPARTFDYLYRLQISDIAATGANNRDELGAVQSALSQLIFKDQLRELFDAHDLGFSISPELEYSYSDYLQQTQHPRTGYWGPWYRFGDRLVPVQDLSMTFHLIQYRNGNVANWPLLVESTLAIKDLVYPAGWRPDSKTQYNNHNNYDLLTIFFYGWPHMNADQKRRARIEIAAMLEWCLTQSLREDGFDPAGGSAIDAYYFGVRFLDRAGFWDPDKRFWLHRMPELPKGTGSAEEICRRLQEGFARLRDQSEEGETVAKLLKVAACLSGPQP